mgnify:CR=1 FL=1
MGVRSIRSAAWLVVVVLLAGCAQGPGHTRALGTLGGAAAGAVIGAAASPCPHDGSAEVGLLLGMVAGTIAAEGLAQDQERYGWCRRCGKPCTDACERTCR